MACYRTRFLNHKRSESLLKELEFRNCDSCSETSVWIHRYNGIELYLPVDTVITSNNDIISLVWKTGFGHGYGEGKRAVMAKLHTELENAMKDVKLAIETI